MALNASHLVTHLILTLDNSMKWVLCPFPFSNEEAEAQKQHTTSSKGTQLVKAEPGTKYLFSQPSSTVLGISRCRG